MEFTGACFDPGGRWLFVNVQTPGGHVRGHQHPAAALAKLYQDLVAIPLLHVAMQLRGADTVLAQETADLPHQLPGIAKHYCGVRPVVAQQLQQGIEPGSLPAQIKLFIYLLAAVA